MESGNEVMQQAPQPGGLLLIRLSTACNVTFRSPVGSLALQGVLDAVACGSSPGGYPGVAADRN